MLAIGIILLVIGAITLAVLLLRNPENKLLIFERAVRDELAKNRDEMSRSLKDFSDTSAKQVMGLTQLNEQKLDNVRQAVEERLKSLQEDNAKKLEQMRATVDEKLHDTLEKRLGQSFKLVSDRLELVHKGLGEMQVLATGVGDLKKVLTNVKTRGTWGEIQLGALLDEIFTPEQYAKNVPTKTGSRDNVEFALKLPGRGGNELVWLPIDAKFPKEDYERLVDAQNEANVELVEELGRVLENRVKAEAKSIRDKYIDPPQTTDFAILFLPTEGLFAEIIRRPGLFGTLQRDYHVTVTGPTTISAFLNSLQMGFRTLAIEKRTSEVWNLLGAVKTEFGKFGDLLDRTHKQLSAVSNTIEGAARKSRTIERKLKDVQQLPVAETPDLLEIGEREC
jgi:DNA recombination protein RmuC